MKKKAGNQQNLMRIIRLLRHSMPMTRQEIAGELDLSMPTALGNIEELLTGGILEETGEKESTGGRRAKLFSLYNDGWYGLGIQISRRHVRFALTNLSGTVLQYERISHPFSDLPSWYRTLGAQLSEFIGKADVEESHILGVGISFPGIIDQENDMILHSHVFDMKNVSLDRFYKYIPYPMIVENDANCACYAEQNNDRDSYLYISLNESVGGALMVDRTLHDGNSWSAGEVGHVILYPGGRDCYCGKKGCADAYLNTGVLLREDENGSEENLEDFFRKLDQGDPDLKDIWNTYLDDLAILCTNMRMVLNMDIILGGDVGALMEPWIEDLCRRMESMDLFSREIDYISSCRCKEHIFSVGASVRAIEYFDERMLQAVYLQK